MGGQKKCMPESRIIDCSIKHVRETLEFLVFDQ